MKWRGRTGPAVMKRPRKIRIKVLLVGAHTLVVEGMRSCLNAHRRFVVVGEASDVKEVIRKARESKPDVVVNILAMDRICGWDLPRYLRRVAPQAKLLTLAPDDNKNFLSQMIHSGAQGYIDKNCSPADLVRAIESIYRGGTFFELEHAETFLHEFLKNGGEVAPHRHRPLSLRECGVLTYVGEGLATKEIAERLHLSVRTVEKHRQRIMNKLAIHKATELVRFAIGQGLVARPARSDASLPRAEERFPGECRLNGHAAC